MMFPELYQTLTRVLSHHETDFISFFQRWFVLVLEGTDKQCRRADRGVRQGNGSMCHAWGQEQILLFNLEDLIYYSWEDSLDVAVLYLLFYLLLWTTGCLGCLRC